MNYHAVQADWRWRVICEQHFIKTKRISESPTHVSNGVRRSRYVLCGGGCVVQQTVSYKPLWLYPPRHSRSSQTTLLRRGACSSKHRFVIDLWIIMIVNIWKTKYLDFIIILWKCLRVVEITCCYAYWSWDYFELRWGYFDFIVLLYICVPPLRISASHGQWIELFTYKWYVTPTDQREMTSNY